ncbi:MAG: hypothetical protein U9N87_11120 [Planctomycetota bacterium]|nr:hypothetical protein [Planctomycetota bacterium]
MTIFLMFAKAAARRLPSRRGAIESSCLTSVDASGLIDCLKAINAGEITLIDALNGAATCVSR